MKYLLDTNIISEATKPNPSSVLATFLKNLPDKSSFISSLTIGEIARGIGLLPEGKRKTNLLAWFDSIIEFYQGRVLDFDINAALIWAEYMSNGSKSGFNRGSIDTMIGSIAKANNCTIVTLNDRDFVGFDLINPLL